MRIEAAAIDPALLDPLGAEADASQRMPAEAVAVLAGDRLLAPLIPQRYGGLGAKYAALGAVCEDLGAICTSMRSLVTVQSMVAGALARWGTAGQRESYLPRLASGELLAGFCLTEHDAGSDGAAVAARLKRTATGWRLTGTKRWITFGQSAQLLLVIARAPDGVTAVLCDLTDPAASRGTVKRTPVRHPLGLRGAMLADLDFDVAVPEDAVLAKPGYGFDHVAQHALDLGRLTVAFGCAGMSRRCLDESADYASRRQQYGKPIAEHQLIRRMLARMLVGTEAARELCAAAARAHDEHSATAVRRSIVAKYFASRAAVSSASDAVQVHGAAGCAAGAAVERIYRDAKIMQIIEGSDQMAEIAIGGFARARSPR